VLDKAKVEEQLSWLIDYGNSFSVFPDNNRTVWFDLRYGGLLARVCPSATPATMRNIAVIKVVVTGSPKKKYAQVIVLRGMRLLNNNTRLVGQ
jgi:hypothetical protein